MICRGMFFYEAYCTDFKVFYPDTAAYNLIFYEPSLLFKKKKILAGLLLAVQWLRLRVPNTGDPGSVLGQGARSLHAATKTRHSQIHKNQH